MSFNLVHCKPWSVSNKLDNREGHRTSGGVRSVLLMTYAYATHRNHADTISRARPSRRTDSESHPAMQRRNWQRTGPEEDQYRHQRWQKNRGLQRGATSHSPSLGTRNATFTHRDSCKPPYEPWYKMADVKSAVAGVLEKWGCQHSRLECRLVSFGISTYTPTSRTCCRVDMSLPNSTPYVCRIQLQSSRHWYSIAISSSPAFASNASAALMNIGVYREREW
jgi:hypothetical protein